VTRVSLTQLPATCFEGVIPSVLSTNSADGVPNATYLSQVLRVDDRHVALTCQFFRKTRANLEENPLGALLLFDPESARQFRLHLRFVRSETEGLIFDVMERRLAAIASLARQEGIFVLRSADVFDVVEIEALEIAEPSPEPDDLDPTESADDGPALDLATLSGLAAAVASAESIEDVLEIGLAGLTALLRAPQIGLYVHEPSEDVLYVLASRGFHRSGIGARIPIGTGIVGVCAQHREAIRIADVRRELRYHLAVREQASRARGGEREIPLPALPHASSILAVPLMVRNGLFGVLATETTALRTFTDRDVQLMSVAGQLVAQAISSFHEDEGRSQITASEPSKAPSELHLRYYTDDDSVFIDDEYVIKGLPGRILWLLVTLRRTEQRSVFSNRELRLHPLLRLPSFKDNLETRLLMLQRRLAEKALGLELDRHERGRVRLVCTRSVEIEVVPAR